MSTQPVTFSEMMQTPVIMGIVNRIATPLSLFQKFFGRQSGTPGTATQVVPGRDCGWDIYDSTRQFAGATTPLKGPRRVVKRKVGHQSAQVMRVHESIVIHDEEVFNTRSLGGRIGNVVDMNGQAHIQRQIAFMIERYRNQREWMYSRMLRGGFNMLDLGNGDFRLKNYNASPPAGEYAINYQIPSTHQGGLDMGTGSDILDDWSDPTSDILDQMYAINKAMTRIHGRPLRHVWCNSTTITNVINNTKIREAGGEAYTVYQFLSPRPEKSREGIQDAGFDIVFRALPLFRFHVYDGVLSPDGTTEGISTSETELLIPDNYAIFLPDPGDWDGLIEGSEPVRENMVSGTKVVSGFHSWATPVIDPPGQELKFLDNYLPYLSNPRCVAYGNTLTGA